VTGLRDRGVGGSNPLAPTNQIANLGPVYWAFLLSAHFSIDSPRTAGLDRLRFFAFHLPVVCRAHEVFCSPPQQGPLSRGGSMDAGALGKALEAVTNPFAWSATSCLL
jgi:hypothetical protein